MDVSVEKLPKSSVKLTISLTPQEVAKHYQTAVKQLSQQVKIEGFRPGKVPRQVLENRVGKEYLDHQALDLAVADAYYQAVLKEQLSPIGRPQTDIAGDHHHLERDGLKFTATVPVLPEVELGNYAKAKVKPVASQYADKLVDETIEQLRKSRAAISQVDRAAKKGDHVEIDFVGTKDGQEFEGGKSENHPLVIGEDNFIPGFADELVGMKAGEVKKFKIKFPKDYHEQSLAGQKVEFTVTMRSVKEATVPALDDEFATGFGAKSMDDLRQRLAENLREEKQREADLATEAAVVQAVVDQAKTEVPDALVEDELGRMAAEMRDNVERQGIPYDKYLEHVGKTEEQILAENKGEAERRVKTSLVLNKLQEVEKLQPQAKEVDAEIARNLEQAQSPDAKEQIKSDEFRRYVTRILGNRLAVARLKEQVLQQLKSDQRMAPAKDCWLICGVTPLTKTSPATNQSRNGGKSAPTRNRKKRPIHPNPLSPSP